MQSPFEIFRKHQKMLTVVLTGLAMFAFVILGAVPDPSAMPPVLGATTHPDLVRQVAALCFEAGAKSVVVTDNPINDPASCFRLTGIAEAVESSGAALVLPRSGFFQPVTLPAGRLIRNWPVLVGPFDGVTKLIGMAPVKDHHRSGASMTMKNWYGLLGG